MKRQSVKFPWDLNRENKTYKIQSYIESKRNMFSNVSEHPARGGTPGKLLPEVYPLLFYILFLIESVLLSYTLTNVPLFTNLFKNFAFL